MRLATQLIESKPGATDRWLVVGHGIFGRGQNWKTIARKLCARCPGWGAVLLDLREHGNSKGLPGPHTLAAAAGDVARVAREHAAQHGPVGGLLGHSFGGKVMLAARALIAELDATWIIDASPSANPQALRTPTRAAPAALGELEDACRTNPAGFASRGQFVAALEARGIEPDVGQFLAMNLAERDAGRYHFDLDLSAIRALLTDYFARDLWSEVERPDGSPLHFAVASRESALSRADSDRLAAIAARGTGVTIDIVADSGHWIHADQPDALLDLLAASLAE